MANPTTHRFITVLNKKIPTGNLMNALGHMSVGFGAKYPEVDTLRLDTYVDADGNEHKNISDNPFIVLRADNSNKIRTLRGMLIEKGIHSVDFTDTMTVGSYAEQKEKTSKTKELDLEYYGICFFTDDETARELTKKFSLWRSD